MWCPFNSLSFSGAPALLDVPWPCDLVGNADLDSNVILSYILDLIEEL